MSLKVKLVLSQKKNHNEIVHRDFELSDEQLPKMKELLKNESDPFKKQQIGAKLEIAKLKIEAKKLDKNSAEYAKIQEIIDDRNQIWFHKDGSAKLIPSPCD